jgi:hypothetical protein
MNIETQLLRILRRGVDPAGAVAEVVGLCRKQDLVPLATPALENLARDLARSLVSERERRFPIDQVATPDALAALAADSFWVNGRAVAWLTATAEDHLARAAQQRRLAGTLVEDAERHEYAAREIQAAGVRCLKDLADAATSVPKPTPGARRRRVPSTEIQAGA